MTSETPAWLNCWKSKEEVEEQEKGIEKPRERWMNRPTFIIASIGAAVGLGNFWRFPYLTYKYGGGFFFFPYLMCLFFMGIPLLIMELGLGQKIQRGDVAVFRGIHPRLAGIGVASVFSAYIICFYYNVIIAWSLVYFIAGFISPLPWSKHNKEFVWKCDKQHYSRAEQFFLINVIRYYNDKCEKYEDGDSSQFSISAFFGTAFVWFCCFIAVFKGVKSASWMVWFTVPLPMILVIILVIRGLSLEGASQGIDQYLNGDNLAKVQFDDIRLADEGKSSNVYWYKEKLSSMTLDQALMNNEIDISKQIDGNLASQDTVWAAACGQIFFSIGVCMGIMTSYGSYNAIRKPIILDNCIICFSNSGVSFVAGFAVWSVVGFLQATNNIAKTKTSSAGLAFIAYPAAIDEMPGSNVWTVLLGLVLFMLGIDSAFSMVEATSTVICDTPAGKKIPRMFVAFTLCFVGFIISIPFCTNWGYVLFDVIDHYLCAYLLIIVGIMQCFGVGWGFDAQMNMLKSENHATSLKFLTICYWCHAVILPIVFVGVKQPAIGLPITGALTLIFAVIPSYMLANLPFWQWYDEIFMCGVGRIGRSIVMLGRPNPQVRQSWEGAFIFYWGILIKYAHPIILMFILVSTCANDTGGYGGYAIGWQIAGISVPAFGLIAFVTCLFWNVYEQNYDKSEFDEQYFMDTAGQFYERPDEILKVEAIAKGKVKTNNISPVNILENGKGQITKDVENPERNEIELVQAPIQKSNPDQLSV